MVDHHPALGRLRRDQLPLALAQLHRTLEVEVEVELDLRGRAWARYGDHRRLVDVLVGAGLEVLGVGGDLQVRCRRLRTLADTVAAGMRVLVCGLNPSEYAADAGIGFARPGNRFWPAAVEAGLTEHPLDPIGALRRDRLGMTDLVKRASPGADVLTRDEYTVGLGRVERLCAWLRPEVVCFVGLAGWRAAVDRRAAAGPQDRDLGGVPVYLCPSTSGRNASAPYDTLVEHLRRAAALAGSAPAGS